LQRLRKCEPIELIDDTNQLVGSKKDLQREFITDVHKSLIPIVKDIPRAADYVDIYLA